MEKCKFCGNPLKDEELRNGFRQKRCVKCGRIGDGQSNLLAK